MRRTTHASSVSFPRPTSGGKERSRGGRAHHAAGIDRKDGRRYHTWRDIIGDQIVYTIVHYSVHYSVHYLHYSVNSVF